MYVVKLQKKISRQNFKFPWFSKAGCISDRNLYYKILSSLHLLSSSKSTSNSEVSYYLYYLLMMRGYYCADILKNYNPMPIGCPRLLFAILAGTPHILLLRVMATRIACTWLVTFIHPCPQRTVFRVMIFQIWHFNPK